MDIVLWRVRIKAGKEDLAREWLSFLKTNQVEGTKPSKMRRSTLKSTL